MADWEAQTQLTPGLNANHFAIAGSGEVVHFVYRNGTNLMYRKSTNQGQSYSVAVDIGDTNEIPLTGALVVEGDSVHVIYDRSDELFHRRSTNAGSSWSSETSLDVAPNNTFYRNSIAVFNGIVHVVYVRTQPSPDFSTDGIFYRRSTDNGATWEAEIELYTSSVSPGRPGLTVDLATGDLHLVWTDRRYGTEAYLGNPGEVVYGRSQDDGVTWDTEIRITTTTVGSVGGTPLRPDVSADEGRVVLVWQDPDGTPGSEDIFITRSEDGGDSFGSNVLLVSEANSQEHATLAQTGDFVLLAWSDKRDGDYVTYERRSFDAGETWLDERIPADSGNAQAAPRMTFTANYILLAHGDGTSGPNQARMEVGMVGYTILNGSDQQLSEVNAGGTAIDAYSHKDGVVLTDTELAALLNGTSFGKRNVAVLADLTDDPQAVARRRAPLIAMGKRSS